MPKISIIIPVYNSEETLKRCLNSILEQEYQDYEIILVNDGSKDNSEKVILEYSEKSNKIKYFSKENSGVADTRNFGIEKATGDYIVFVDSDDYIKNTMFTDIENYINDGIELIKWKGIIVDENENELLKISGPIFDKTTGEDGFNKLYSEDKFIDALWVYAIKRSIFVDNNFKFTTNTYHEDFGLLPLIIVKAESMVSIEKYNYYYVQTENSIMRGNDYKKELKKAYDSLEQYDNISKAIENYNLEVVTKENIKLFCTNTILLKIELLKKEDQNKYIKEIRKRKMVKNIKVRNIKQLIKRILLGINIKLYLKMR